jgi:hypothetical protein
VSAAISARSCTAAGLVAYWQFDECLGDRVREKIGTARATNPEHNPGHGPGHGRTNVKLPSQLEPICT